MARPRTGKSTIGRDPWGAVIPVADEDDVVPTQAVVRKRGRPRTRATVVLPDEAPKPAAIALAAPTPTAPHEAPSEPTATVGEGGERGRSKLTVHMDRDLVNRVKNAAYWNPRLTIARIAEAGIRLALDQVEKEHGGPYPQREGELVGGRPIR